VHEVDRLENLTRKVLDNAHWEPMVIRFLDDLVQVLPELFKNQAVVVFPLKGLVESHDMRLTFRISPIELLKDLCLYFGRMDIAFDLANDLDRLGGLVAGIFHLKHPAKCAIP
jgi:hypothetical protein